MSEDFIWMKASPEGRPCREKVRRSSERLPGVNASQLSVKWSRSDLLVEDHVDPVGFDVDGVLAHELQDVLDAGGVRQTTETDTVACAAGRWKKWRRGEDRDGHDG